MIIDGYNGLLCNPNVDDVVAKVELLIENSRLRRTLIDNARQVARHSFCLNTWADKWFDVISFVAQESRHAVATDVSK